MASSSLMTLFTICWISLLAPVTFAAIKATDDNSAIKISNDRLAFSISKGSGTVSTLSLDGQDLLGSGRGPYLDCHCVADGFWTPGSGGTYKLFRGSDKAGVAYAGAVMSQNYQNTGKTLEQYWFLRDGETGIHSFSRAAYKNTKTPNGGDLGEMRVLFRPSTNLWTHLSSSDDMWGPLPSTSGAPSVQDATWYVGGNKNHPYVKDVSDYFTKYMFSEMWRDTSVHGLFSDGTNSKDGSSFGAWLVMNTKDTYFGGPTHSDLTVDGIVYNYVVSNHHGNGVPAMRDGFDRTFGPQYYYFNKGAKGASLQTLRADASKYADANFDADFYDSIAQYVPNYVPTSGRGTWKGNITLPKGATRPLAVLSPSGLDFQDSNLKPTGYQYWADIAADGTVTIPRVKAGDYRLTVYADGIFGQYVQDNIHVSAGSTQNTVATWAAESAGTELWRIGTPDKSSGDFRHGNERDTTRTRRPRQYRLYWAVHDFPTDFPNGVNFTIGRDDIQKGLNYVHWNVFGGKGNSIRKEVYTKNVNEWKLFFDLDSAAIANKTTATFTVQLAGAKTSAGNNDGGSQDLANLPYTVTVNGKALPVWTIPSNKSSSCAVRSAVTCFTLGNKFVFDVSLLKAGTNLFTLSLPAGKTVPESAVLFEGVYVQYDALRLEVE